MGLVLKRSDTWATREFPQFLKAAESVPFEWGKNDCCLFVANAVQSMTGIDIASDFRDQYSDELGAFRTVRDITGKLGIEDALMYVAAKHNLYEWLMQMDQHARCARNGAMSALYRTVQTSSRE